jgi:hypothetical protein
VGEAGGAAGSQFQAEESFNHFWSPSDGSMGIRDRRDGEVDKVVEVGFASTWDGGRPLDDQMLRNAKRKDFKCGATVKRPSRRCAARAPESISRNIPTSSHHATFHSSTLHTTKNLCLKIWELRLALLGLLI